MARRHIEPFVDRDVSFKKFNLPRFPSGMQYKMLSFDYDTGACSMTVQFDSGYTRPPGLSLSEWELFIMDGSIQIGEKLYRKGQYWSVPPGVAMPAMYSKEGAQALCFYNHGEPSFEESDESADKQAETRLVQVNAYDDMPWGGTVLYPATEPGCLVKILRYDEHTGAMSFLYTMTPGFWQDNISYHDCAEEGYHIYGDSWMMQFGVLPTGGYFYRQPWINHGPFSCDTGCLAFGRTDSVLHNYFHYDPYTTVEENIERAAHQLHLKKPELFKWVQQHSHNHHDLSHDHDHDHDHDHQHEHGHHHHHHHEHS